MDKSHAVAARSNRPHPFPWRVVVVVWLVLGMVEPVHAQVIPGEVVRPDQETCRQAVTARPIDEMVPQRAQFWLEVLAECGDPGIQVLVQLIRDAAMYTDEQGWNFEMLLGMVSRIRDPRIADAAVSLALDPDSPTSARVFAVLAGLGQHAPSAEANFRMPFHELLAGRQFPRCPLLPGNTRRSPRLDDTVRREHFRQALGRIAADETVSPGLRQLAGCALAYVRD